MRAAWAEPDPARDQGGGQAATTQKRQRASSPPVKALRREALKLKRLVKSDWVRQFLDATRHLPDIKARKMAHKLGWQEGPYAEVLKQGLFAWYTIVKKPDAP